MAGLDTNVLVRWLVNDDAAQAATVRRLMSLVPTGQPLLVPITVTLELEWVLRARYRFDKVSVLSAFDALLETDEMQFQHDQSVEWALRTYRDGSADFADCLHAALCVWEECSPLMTFDTRAARLTGVELLNARANARAVGP